MDKTKTVLIVLAVGLLILAGTLSFNLLSPPSNEYQQVPIPSYGEPSGKAPVATAQMVTQILPAEVQK
ncbi:hypothetical protein KY309_03615 [Candidatus Woesearchaeota archaeon]|nr:hypothetical protein [Candidatus Woesearchaeota archaeon]MBW3016670.1 hypothetical protein [Candidatus Woesearchaeota archaeon]